MCVCVNIPDERSNQLLVLRTQHQGWREQSSTERLVSKERHYSILQEAAGLVFEDRRSDMRQSRGSAPDDMQVAADIMADLQHAQEIESQMLLGLHSKVRAGLEIATDTVANASTTFNLATKNSSLVATLATMFR